MSRARDLSKLGNINVLSADDVSSEVGIATTVPRSTLDVRGEVKVGTAIQAGTAGVLTATTFSGGLSGDITGAACTFTTATFNGNVTIGGTLTYEDVTNVDSLGIVTARAGVNVSGGQLAVGVAYSVGAAGVATAAGFVGPLTGNADTATTATTATNVTVTANNSTDETVYPIFVDGATGSQGAESDTGLTYNPSDGNLTSTTFTGAVTGNVTGTASNASGATGDFSIADKIVHTGDTNTAIRFPSADTVSVETGGTERIRITSAGRLGIGTNSPSHELDIESVSPTIELKDSDNNYTLQLTQSGSASYVDFDTTGGGSSSLRIRNAGTERIRITSGGLVGIGSDAPESALVVQGGTGNTPIVARSTDTRSQISFLDNATTGVGHVAVGCEGNDLFIRTGSGSKTLTITSGGELLVNHSASDGSGKIQAYASNQDGVDILSYSTTDTHGGRLTFYRSKNATVGSNTEVADGDSLGRIDWRGYNDDGTTYNQGARIEALVDGAVNSTTDMPTALVFKTSENGSSTPTERVRIDSSGHVGLGTDDPAQDFHIQSGSGTMRIESTSDATSSRIEILGKDNSYAGLHMGDTADVDAGGFRYYNTDNYLQIRTNGDERLRIASAGQIGIGGANYGTDGQVLTSGGASAAPSWADAGGVWQLINKQIIPQNTSNVDVSLGANAGITTAYAAIKVYFDFWLYSADKVYIKGGEGFSGTVDSRLHSSDYWYAGLYNRAGETTVQQGNISGENQNQGLVSGNNNKKQHSGEILIANAGGRLNTLGSSNWPILSYSARGMSGGDDDVVWWSTAGHLKGHDNDILSCFRVYAGVTIQSGAMRTYGLTA